MAATAAGYKFVITCQEGMGSFTSNALEGFNRDEYAGLISITGNKADLEMAHFDNFLLLCEKLEKQTGCLLIEYDPKKEVWKRM